MGALEARLQLGNIAAGIVAEALSKRNSSRIAKLDSILSVELANNVDNAGREKGFGTLSDGYDCPIVHP